MTLYSLGAEGDSKGRHGRTNGGISLEGNSDEGAVVKGWSHIKAIFRECLETLPSDRDVRACEAARTYGIMN